MCTKSMRYCMLPLCAVCCFSGSYEMNPIVALSSLLVYYTTKFMIANVI